MRDSLRPGLEHVLRFTVTDRKTVPELYPEAPGFTVMPRVFATGFLVGLVEWACLELLEPHLDGPAEQSVGTHVDLSHSAATPPGFVVTVSVRLVAVDGRRLRFEVSAHDGVDEITRGVHERVVIDTARFRASLDKKISRANAGSA